MKFLRRLGAISGLSTSIGATSEPPVSKVVADAKEASAWVANALRSSGYQADFSLDSLREIDRFFEEHAPNGKAVPGGLLSEDLGGRIFALGAYTGEVILRHSSGTWVGDDSDPKAEISISIFLDSGTQFWPVQRVMKRLIHGNEDSIYEYGYTLATP